MSGLGLLKTLGKKPDDVAPERRRSLRTATVFQVAKLITGRYEELCLLRDVSPTGLKAEVYCPLAIGDRIEIELKTEHRVAGEVVWAQDALIGIHFDEEVPVLAMLAHCAFDDRIARIRGSRLACTLPGTLEVDEEELAVTVLNISLAGMKVRLGQTPGDMRAVALLPELGRRACSIRWVRGGEAGILFDEPMTYPDFVDWRRRLLRAGPKALA